MGYCFRAFILLVLFCSQLVLAHSPPSSNAYRLDVADFDSGGLKSQSFNRVMVSQTLSPLVTGQTAKNNRKLVQGKHVSSYVLSLSGPKPYDRLGVTLNVSQTGLMTSKLEFKANNGSADLLFSDAYDTAILDGWGMVWPSTESLNNQDSTLTFLARAFDGLTWGPWFETSTAVVVDNLKPSVSNVLINPPIFSPNNSSSVGVKDSSQFSFDITEPYLDHWSIAILDGQEQIERDIVVSGSGLTVSETWDGKNDAAGYSEDNPYTVKMSLKDRSGNQAVVTQSVIVDNTSPTLNSVILTAQGAALNSQQGHVYGSWSGSDRFDTQLSYDVYSVSKRFSPRSISGLQLWLDASQETRMTFFSGNTVKRWEDQSGLGHHASQTDELRAPVWITKNGKKAVSFDGVDNYLALNMSYAGDSYDHVYVFVVADSQSTTAQTIVGFDRDHFWQFSLPSTPSPYYLGWDSHHSGIAYDLRSASSVFDADPHVFTGGFSTSMTPEKILRVDGGQVASQTVSESGLGSVQTRYGFLGTDSAASSFDGGVESGLYFTGQIYEVLIYHAALTQQNIEDIEEYLNIKWSISQDYAWTQEKDDTALTQVNKLNQSDSTFFRYKVLAFDEAGNATVTTSLSALTPDRTPPVIDADFTEIRTTEDVSIVMNPSEYKSDEVSYDEWLTWTTGYYSNEENLLKSAEPLILNVSSTFDASGNASQWLSVVVSPDANTDPLVDPPVDGNRYGKSEGWLKVTLVDEAGNTVSKDIQLHIAPVNDAPIFSADIGGVLIQRDTENQLIYNLKFDEDTNSPVLYLDDYVLDVDNLHSQLNFLVSGNYYQDTSESGPSDYFKRTNSFYNTVEFTVQVKDEQNQHELVLTPTANWWGDESFELIVYDPDNTSSNQRLVARVWPVNDPPIISDTILTQAVSTEDETLTLRLAAYESDTIYEDEVPTYSAQLKWRVVEYDANVITTISGEGGASDELVFSPSPNVYGTTNVVIELSDSDTRPELVYPINTPGGSYIADPKAVTRSVTLVWTPVNDAPVIGLNGNPAQPVPGQIRDEDSGQWSVDLSNYKSDVEDTDSALSVAVSIDSDRYATVTYNNVTNILTVTPKPNAWGTANITLTLTDTDESIAFTPYTPQPLSYIQNVVVTLNPVNDVPSLGVTQLAGKNSPRLDMVMSTDEVIVTALGFDDIGFQNDQASPNQLGNEYDSRITLFGEIENQKRYNYRWYIGESETDPNRVLVTSNLLSASPTDSFLVQADLYTGYPSLEGKTITVEVSPDDQVDQGPVFTKSILVNTRPNVLGFSLSTPGEDSYTNTGNVTVSWSSVTDPDGAVDDNRIGYRYKVWKVPKWAPAPEDTSLENTETFYDSGWVKDMTDVDVLDLGKLYEHGTYYWSVWTGNDFDSQTWDYRDPSWLKHFNVDLVNPEYAEFSEYIQLNDITQNALIFDSGNTRVLFGSKPEDQDDSWLYAIILEYENAIEDEFGGTTITTGSETIVEATASPNWSYTISYPEGTTTYNVIIRDLADNIGDESVLYSFTITGDNIPPIPFEIGENYVSTFSVITSGDTYIISGKKEKQSGILFTGYNEQTATTDAYQVVGFTPLDTYSFAIYPWKSSGHLVAVDRAGNLAPSQTYLDLQFLIGPPDLTSVSQSRSTINSIANEALLQGEGLDSTEITSITQAQVTITSNRKLSVAQVKLGDAVLETLSNLDAGQPGVFTIHGNDTRLAHGLNTLTVSVQDEALNVAEVEYALTVLKVPPKIEILNSARLLNVTNGRGTIDIIGSVEDGVSYTINGNPVQLFENGKNWFYIEPNFSIVTGNIVLEAQDTVYNKADKTLWSQTYYTSYVGVADIPLPITEVSARRTGSDGILLYHSQLPPSLSQLYSRKLFKEGLDDLVFGISPSTKSLAFSIKKGMGPYQVSESLNPHFYQVYGLNDAAQIVSESDLEGYQIHVGLPFSQSHPVNPDTLKVVRFDAQLGEWELVPGTQRVDYQRNRIIAPIQKMGVYALSRPSFFATDLSALLVYPNPWRPHDQNDDTGTLATGIQFENMTQGAKIRIYTVAGQLVKSALVSQSTWAWDGTNQSGNPVFSGVYLYHISDGNESKTGKLTIIR